MIKSCSHHVATDVPYVDAYSTCSMYRGNIAEGLGYASAAQQQHLSLWSKPEECILARGRHNWGFTF